MFVDWESMLDETTSQDMKLWFHVQRLQERYISALDTDRLEEWPELFTEDCVYEVLPGGTRITSGQALSCVAWALDVTPGSRHCASRRDSNRTSTGT